MNGCCQNEVYICLELFWTVFHDFFFFLKKAILWIEVSYFSNGLKLNILVMDLFLTNMQLLATYDFNWWSGVHGVLLVDYYDVFISCLDSHSDGTHSLHRIHCWASDVMLHFSKSDEEKNSFTSWMAWRWVHFQQMFIQGYSISALL